MDKPRLPTPDERKLLEMPTETLIVTDEATEDYNCLGFCLGVVAFLRWPISEMGPSYMERMGCQRLERPLDTGTVIAMYERPQREPHVAKRLRGDWYESKCGPGPRIVHCLHDIERVYGNAISYWISDEQATDAALKTVEAEEMRFGSPAFMPIADSLTLFGENLIVALARLRARQ
jgi:hypothetical protein